MAPTFTTITSTPRTNCLLNHHCCPTLGACTNDGFTDLVHRDGTRRSMSSWEQTYLPAWYAVGYGGVCLGWVDVGGLRGGLQQKVRCVKMGGAKGWG